jgi:hypothetical protein
MFRSAVETIMERNLIRPGLVIVTLGTEAWLLLMGAGFAFAGADSGRGEFGLAVRPGESLLTLADTDSRGRALATERNGPRPIPAHAAST